MWAKLGEWIVSALFGKIFSLAYAFIEKAVYVWKRMKGIKKTNEVKKDEYKENPSDDSFSRLP